jgi:hypothetical protein
VLHGFHRGLGLASEPALCLTGTGREPQHCGLKVAVVIPGLDATHTHPQMLGEDHRDNRISSFLKRGLFVHKR